MPRRRQPSVIHVSASHLGGLGVVVCLEQSRFETTHVDESGEACLAILDDLHPDLVIIGSLYPEPPHRPFTLCREITERWPNLPVILIHLNADNDLIQADAMIVGATACLPVTGLSCDDLAVTCRSVTDGTYRAPNRDLYISAFGADSITRRQFDVLRLAAENKSATEIAAVLEIASNTVKAHERIIREKFNVTSVPAAVERARRLGIV